jgi:hypothetical protein
MPLLARGQGASKAKNLMRDMPLARPSARLVLWVEQPVQMHDKVAHMGVVDGAVGGVLPGVVGLRVMPTMSRALRSPNSILSSEVSSPPKHEVQQLPPTAFAAPFCGHA